MTKHTQELKGCDELNEGLLLVDQARMSILDSVSILTEKENVPIREALSRVVADDIDSPINVPAHTGIWVR